MLALRIFGKAIFDAKPQSHVTAALQIYDQHTEPGRIMPLLVSTHRLLAAFFLSSSD